jgi:hypothetical protein
MRIVTARVAFLLVVMALADGCATAGPGAQPTELVLTGRVVSATEVTGMMGDVALVWNAYVVAPQDGSGQEAVVVDAGSDCAVPGAGAQVYRFRLQRERRVFAVTGDSDKAAPSDLFVVSCERLPSQGAS